MALVLAGVLLAGLFRDHVLRQFTATLTAQLDQVTARLEFDAGGRPVLDAGALSDPRWSRPHSGLYWQIDAEAGAEPHVQRRAVLRSRSLWDATLALPADALAGGVVHVHEVAGPRGEALWVVERTIRRDAGAAGGATGAAAAAEGAPWRLIVAADLGETRAAMQRFNGVLAASLAVLLALLGAATWAQLSVGLAPLRTLQRALAAVHEGRTQRLEGAVPAEVQPLVDDFNAVLAHQAEGVARARALAGDLAHALKTPLAAMQQAATAARRDAAAAAELPRLVHEQVVRAQRHVDWHLARSRAAATRGLPGARAEVAPVLAALMRVMEKVHAARALRLTVQPFDAACTFAGEAEDLQAIVGNLLDNACKWARHEVRVAVRGEAAAASPSLIICIEDDGPGIAQEHRAAVLARGARLDESTPGSGLGLSIATELVSLYGGTLDLQGQPPAGLRAVVRLPAAAGASPRGLFSATSGM
ncbi:MAG: sensor histidine kinase [Burkholderiales bacterium]|nr:sensor histidine kinase [Burkholderiales bacterium]